MIQPPRQDRERRKAQNRASQRAYRERKEVQLRDLAASLKELEMAMAEAKHDNEQLEDRLGRMKNEMEVLRKENEALRRTEEAPQAGSRVQEKITLTRDKLSMETTRRVQGKPMLPHSDEGYEGDSRSNTASAISTPKDMDMGVDDQIFS
jgi:regulator of replication initiation timing